MNHAPSVNYPVGRSRGAGVLLMVAGSAGLAATVSWALQRQAPGLGSMIPALACLALVAWAALDWFRTTTGMLSWEGGHWRWSGHRTGAGQIRVCLDLQGLLLLQWRADDGSSAWLWLERRQRPALWSDLRRAVYSRANSDALPGAEPPAANP